MHDLVTRPYDLSHKPNPPVRAGSGKQPFQPTDIELDLILSTQPQIVVAREVGISRSVVSRLRKHYTLTEGAMRR
jgi:hypothetical protein